MCKSITVCDHYRDAERISRILIGIRKLSDPPWQFTNRTGKMAPEHKRLNRYQTLALDDICNLPVGKIADTSAHLYLWVPNALLPEGLKVMAAWGFNYKSNIIWHKVRKDGGPDGRGVGFYFRNTTEIILFGVRGSMRTLQPGRTQVNIIRTMKQEHSRKPDELYDIIESCSPAPYLELFARGTRSGWTGWGNQAESYEIGWDTYKNNSKNLTVQGKAWNQHVEKGERSRYEQARTEVEGQRETSESVRDGGHGDRSAVETNSTGSG